MKTFYTTHLFEPHKITIDNELETRIQEARDEVFRLATGNNWRPSIEIDLPQAVDENDDFHHRNFIVKVTWDDGTEDNVHQRVLKFLAGREARGWVRADLGHYCYEGWDSAVDHRDLSELPDIWFKHGFVDGFIEPESKHGNKSWDVLEEGHQRQLIPILYRQARLQMRYWKDSEYFSKRIPFLETLTAGCKEVWRGEKKFIDLTQLCEQAMIRESESNGSQERAI